MSTNNSLNKLQNIEVSHMMPTVLRRVMPSRKVGAVLSQSDVVIAVDFDSR
jgi:hypothetical protein